MTDSEFMQKHVFSLSKKYLDLSEKYKQLSKEILILRATLNQHIGAEVKTAKIIKMIPRKLKKVADNEIL